MKIRNIAFLSKQRVTLAVPAHSNSRSRSKQHKSPLRTSDSIVFDGRKVTFKKQEEEMGKTFIFDFCEDNHLQMQLKVCTSKSNKLIVICGGQNSNKQFLFQSLTNGCIKYAVHSFGYSLIDGIQNPTINFKNSPDSDSIRIDIHKLLVKRLQNQAVFVQFKGSSRISILMMPDWNLVYSKKSQNLKVKEMISHLSQFFVKQQISSVNFISNIQQPNKLWSQCDVIYCMSLQIRYFIQSKNLAYYSKKVKSEISKHQKEVAKEQSQNVASQIEFQNSAEDLSKLLTKYSKFQKNMKYAKQFSMLVEKIDKLRKSKSVPIKKKVAQLASIMKQANQIRDSSILNNQEQTANKRAINKTQKIQPKSVNQAKRKSEYERQGQLQRINSKASLKQDKDQSKKSLQQKSDSKKIQNTETRRIQKKFKNNLQQIIRGTKEKITEEHTQSKSQQLNDRQKKREKNKKLTNVSKSSDNNGRQASLLAAKQTEKLQQKMKLLKHQLCQKNKQLVDKLQIIERQKLKINSLETKARSKAHDATQLSHLKNQFQKLQNKFQSSSSALEAQITRLKFQKSKLQEKLMRQRQGKIENYPQIIYNLEEQLKLLKNLISIQKQQNQKKQREIQKLIKAGGHEVSFDETQGAKPVHFNYFNQKIAELKSMLQLEQLRNDQLSFDYKLSMEENGKLNQAFKQRQDRLVAQIRKNAQLELKINQKQIEIAQTRQNLVALRGDRQKIFIERKSTERQKLQVAQQRDQLLVERDRLIKHLQQMQIRVQESLNNNMFRQQQMSKLNQQVVQLKQMRDMYKQKYLQYRYSPQLKSKHEKQGQKEQKLKLLGQIQSMIQQHKSK